MRLLTFDEREEVTLTRKLFDDDIPPYAILSHTWGADDDEVSFDDMVKGTFNRSCSGFKKIQFCIERAKADKISHFWIDTCCIEKSSSSELSEAIQSMFHWYREAVKCYVYLSDVGNPDLSSLHYWRPFFCSSRWFTRGWTLQELLAPKIVEFYSRAGYFLGDKGSLESGIKAATGIPVKALRGSPLSDFSVEERMSWAAKRETKRREDKAYCLLGIFDVNMPLLYGERDKALTRLWEEIRKANGHRTTEAYKEQQHSDTRNHTGSATLPATRSTPDALLNTPPQFARFRTPSEEEIQKTDRNQTTKPYDDHQRRNTHTNAGSLDRPVPRSIHNASATIPPRLFRRRTPDEEEHIQKAEGYQTTKPYDDQQLSYTRTDTGLPYRPFPKSTPDASRVPPLQRAHSSATDRLLTGVATNRQGSSMQHISNDTQRHEETSDSDSAKTMNGIRRSYQRPRAKLNKTAAHPDPFARRDSITEQQEWMETYITPMPSSTCTNRQGSSMQHISNDTQRHEETSDSDSAKTMNGIRRSYQRLRAKLNKTAAHPDPFARRDSITEQQEWMQTYLTPMPSSTWDDYFSRRMVPRRLGRYLGL